MTWEEIISPEPAIEDAVRGVLQSLSRPLPLPIYRRLEALEVDNQRIEVACIRGVETGHRGQYSAGLFAADAWEAVLRVTVRSYRSADARRAHWAMISAIRIAMMPAAALFHLGNLPSHGIAQMIPQAPEPSLDTDGNEDGTVLVWSLIVSVRAGAMPAYPPSC